MTIAPEVLVAGGVGIAATVEDLWRRQVSNWIPVIALLGGLMCWVLAEGWMGILSALGGAVSGFFAFSIFYWLGGMGGADLKLMAGFGAVLGAGRLLEAALWTAAIGGLIAAAVVTVGVLRGFWRKRAGKAPAGRPSDYIPYAPAITLGAWLALVPKS